MSIELFRDALRDAIKKAGSQKEWADGHAVSPSYVGAVLNTPKEPGEKLLAAMRWRRVVTYEPVKLASRAPGGEG